MCSGERSSSANGAIALRAVGGRGVVDLEQQRLVATGRSGGRRSSGGASRGRRRGSAGGRCVQPARPCAARGRPRRWRARSTGPSSSAATGWGRCRRRRWSQRRRRADPEPGGAEVADQGGQPHQRLADQQLGDRGGAVGHVHVEVVGVVVGDHRRDRVLGEQVVERAHHQRDVVDVGGLEHGPQLGLEGPHATRRHAATTERCSHERSARCSRSASSSARSALTATLRARRTG